MGFMRLLLEEESSDESNDTLIQNQLLNRRYTEDLPRREECFITDDRQGGSQDEALQITMLPAG